MKQHYYLHTGIFMKKNNKFIFLITVVLIILLTGTVYITYMRDRESVEMLMIIPIAVMVLLLCTFFLMYEFKLKDLLEARRNRADAAETETDYYMDAKGYLVARYDIRKKTLTIPKDYAAERNVPRVTHNVPYSLEKQCRDRLSREDLEKHRKFYEDIENGIPEGVMELKFTYADNTVEWKRYTYKTVFAGKVPVKAIVTVELINEERKLEKKYEKLLAWVENARHEDSLAHAVIDVTADRLESSSSLSKSDDENLVGASIKHFYMKYCADTTIDENGRVFSDVFSRENMLAYFETGTTVFSDDWQNESNDGCSWINVTVELTQNPLDNHVMAFLVFFDNSADKEKTRKRFRTGETDALTGVYNRYSVNRIINNSFEKAESGCTLAILEITAVKRINSEVGREEGDRVIKLIVGRLKDAFPGDVIGRISGDRFLIYSLRETVSQRVKEILDTINSSLENVYPGGRKDISVKFRAGVTSSFEGASINLLRKQADLALHTAKRSELVHVAIYNLDAAPAWLSNKEVSDESNSYDNNPAALAIAQSYVEWLVKEKLDSFSRRRERVFADADIEHLARRQELEVRVLTLNSLVGSNPALYAEELLRIICDYFEADEAYLATFSKEIAFVQVNVKDKAAAMQIVHAGLSLSDRLLEFLSDDQFVWMPSKEELRNEQTEIYKFLKNTGVDNAIAVPVIMGSRLYGFFCSVNLKKNIGDFFLLSVITEMLKIKIDQSLIREQSNKERFFDNLTGYMNFEGFVREVRKITAIPNVLEEGEKFAVLYTDIRRLKLINDTAGFETGNQVIREWAELLAEEQRENETFCRVSADHFCVLKRFRDEEEINEFFSHMTDRINEFTLSDNDINLEISPVCGVCVIEDSKNFDLEEVINRANLAKKEGKKQSGNTIEYYNSSFHEAMLNSLKLEAEAAEALTNGEFVAFFQPKVCINDEISDPVIHAEALARWVRDGKIYQSPGAFIPLFEANGKISELDLRIFTESCRAIREFKKAGLKMCISVNLSRITLMKPEVLEEYELVRKNFGVKPSELEIEFTESIAVTDFDALMSALCFFRERGYVCSMDDFGSFYSSLNMLQKLPLDILKIDQKFFHASDKTERQRAVVKNVLNMARDLGMFTVAEGVEEEEQVEFLKQTGCEFIQGFYFSKPLPEEDFLNWSKRETEKITNR